MSNNRKKIVDRLYIQLQESQTHTLTQSHEQTLTQSNQPTKRQQFYFISAFLLQNCSADHILASCP